MSAINNLGISFKINTKNILSDSSVLESLSNIVFSDKKTIEKNIEDIFTKAVKDRGKYATGALAENIDVEISKVNSGGSIEYNIFFNTLDYFSDVNYGTFGSDYNGVNEKEFIKDILRWVKAKRIALANYKRDNLRSGTIYGTTDERNRFRISSDYQVAVAIAKSIMENGIRDSRYQFLGINKGIGVSTSTDIYKRIREQNISSYKKHKDFLLDVIIDKTKDYLLDIIGSRG